MRAYLVELYVPRSRRAGAFALASRVRAVAEELEREGQQIRYVRTMFLPDEETCFQLVHAPSREAVGELCRRADLGHNRIVRVVEAQ